VGELGGGSGLAETRRHGDRVTTGHVQFHRRLVAVVGGGRREGSDRVGQARGRGGDEWQFVRGGATHEDRGSS